MERIIRIPAKSRWLPEPDLRAGPIEFHWKEKLWKAVRSVPAACLTWAINSTLRTNQGSRRCRESRGREKVRSVIMVRLGGVF